MFLMFTQFSAQSVMLEGISVGWIRPRGLTVPISASATAGGRATHKIIQKAKGCPSLPPGKPKGDWEWLPFIFQNPEEYSRREGEIDFLLQ